MRLRRPSGINWSAPPPLMLVDSLIHTCPLSPQPLTLKRTVTVALLGIGDEGGREGAQLGGNARVQAVLRGWGARAGGGRRGSK